MGKQISIFVENKPGKINRITGILAEEGVNMRAMTIADSGSFGIIKILTDQNEKAFHALKKHNFLVSFQRVVIVAIPDEVGAFHRVARLLEEQGINIEDAYGFILEETGKAALILKVSEPEKVETLLRENGYGFLEEKF